jgi:transcriptional regulator
MLMEMIDAHEPDYRGRWEQLSQRYRDGMKQGVVGVEVAVTRLEGKAKLSQNKTDAEDHVVQIGYAMTQNKSTE